MLRRHEGCGEARGLVPGRPLVERIHDRRGRLTPRQRMEGEELVAERARGVRLRRYRSLLAAAGVLALVGLVLGWERGRVRPLSVAVEGGHLEGRGMVASDGPAAPVIHFSDGSEVALGAASTARIRSVDARGACISLSRGSAHVDIVHRSESRWMVEAGPFVIRVTGTAFTVQWTADREDLDVHMDRGSVEISGPVSGGAMALRSGQHLIVHVRQRETLVREDGSPGAVEARAATLQGGLPVGSDNGAASSSVGAAASGESADGISSGEALDPAQPETASAAANRRSAISARHWREALAKGHGEAVLSDAEEIGLETCLGTANQQDLAALADAARYSRHDDLARRALSALVRRFPRSGEGRDAMFLLGRLDEANGDTPGALALYGQYLGEGVNVRYASEALGRRVILTQHEYGDARARPIAEDYLRRFPQGTYAASARALIGVH